MINLRIQEIDASLTLVHQNGAGRIRAAAVGFSLGLGFFIPA
jgi:hypothetical protein